MSKKAIYYKCVNNGTLFPRLTSACQNSDMSDSIRVQYKENKWVEPNLKGSKLFIFGSLEDVERFLNRNFMYDIEIWECEAEDVEEIDGYMGLLERIASYWVEPLNEEYQDTRNKWPNGTLIASRVKLTRKIMEYV